MLLGLAVELDRVQLLPGGEEVRGVLGEYLVKGVLGLGRGLGLRLGLGRGLELRLGLGRGLGLR